MSQQSRGWHVLRLMLLYCAAALILAGCSPRPGPDVLKPVGSSAASGQVMQIYVATTRAKASGIGYSAERASELSYAVYDVSIPPTHEPGQIEFPSGEADPRTDFTVVERTELDRGTFLAGIRRNSRQSQTGTAGVFVHGYNYSFQESLFRLAQISADANIDGVPVLFAWPSDAHPLAYVADREGASFSRDALADLLADMNHGTGRTLLFGHSMGAWLSIEALRTLKLRGARHVLDRLDVILAAPDIDIHVFDSQMQVIGTMKEPIVALVSPDDRALALSGRLSAQRPRLGALAVDDPRVVAAAKRSNVQVIDISQIETDDLTGHGRYIRLAALYPRLVATETQGRGVRTAGAFIFDALEEALLLPVVRARAN
ncbi:Esterase/lipase superfamily enzyme [Salinihabitans flavidus]|uniref:Esterase/lipase superfamily enzyme n=1 Tax=Salinihabitans flavidus TaxID=569882 RepID=A0A1H8PSG6_9RHOB|nr:alpha/beta fold hydrolase [Salinihabitans flavidus]SEO44493.1 Esterase/lipase superfamily enzyme [Salinihabitans flavidus]